MRFLSGLARDAGCWRPDCGQLVRVMSASLVWKGRCLRSCKRTRRYGALDVPYASPVLCFSRAGPVYFLTESFSCGHLPGGFRTPQCFSSRAITERSPSYRDPLARTVECARPADRGGLHQRRLVRQPALSAGYAKLFAYVDCSGFATQQCLCARHDCRPSPFDAGKRRERLINYKAFK